MNLDDPSLFHEFDPDDMLGHIRALPDQVEVAWELAQEYPLPPEPDRISRIVVVGMGGSAIGGELVSALVADEFRMPIVSVRGYELPAFAAGPETLVISCSHSGNTEETLTASAMALERETQLVAITTGGKLAAFAREHGLPLWTYDYRSQPRAALGYGMTLILGLISRLGGASLRSQVTEAVAVMRGNLPALDADSPSGQNPAKQMALALVGKLPVVYGAGIMGPVAHRWKTQLNENSKSWAEFEVMPELNHNAVVGISHPEWIGDRVTVVMLRSKYDSPRIARRFDLTEQLLRNAGIEVYHIDGIGEGRLAQMMSALHYGDFVSFYLAMAYEVDPTPVEPIAWLKARLAEVRDL